MPDSIWGFVWATTQNVMFGLDEIRPFSLVLVAAVGLWLLRFLWRLLVLPLGGFFSGYSSGSGKGE